MNIRSICLASIVLLASPCIGVSADADESSSDVTIERDLTAVIALHGFPCGPVVSVVQQGADNYLASCQDGNRYRVLMNAEGRVIVEKQ